MRPVRCIPFGVPDRRLHLYAMLNRSVLLALVAALAACGPPRAVALPGNAAPVQALPRGTMLQGHRKVVYQWELHDGEILARGDGVARIASPDSVRMDFFL